MKHDQSAQFLNHQLYTIFKTPNTRKNLLYQNILLFKIKARGNKDYKSRDILK